MPDYTWVGIYLLDGNELVLGPVRRQAVAAHAHSARPRHLRRRRHREGDDHRRRRERGPAIPGVQHRDAVGDRRADHARTREVLGEIDIDSDRLAAFGQDDKALLEAVAAAARAALTTCPAGDRSEPTRR